MSHENSVKRTNIVKVILSFFILALTYTPYTDAKNEQTLQTLPINHIIFGGEKHTLAHVETKYFSGGLSQKQSQRLASITETLKATTTAFKSLNLPAFLEGASLLGYYRHNTVIPFDVDGDVGVFASDCRRLFPRKGELKRRLQAALSDRFEVTRMACDCESAHTVAGRVVDKHTGFFVDIFVYDYIEEKNLKPWQKAISQEWLTRINEPGPFCIPIHVLFPLKEVTFLGSSDFFVANDVEKFLNFDFGMVLDIPLVPFKLLTYTSTSWFSIVGVFLCAWIQKAWLELSLALVFVVFADNGLQLLGFIYTAVLLSKNRGKPAVLVAVWSFLLYDASSIFMQLKRILMEILWRQNVNPDRLFTLCLLNSCFDF